jgi:hypothetical protein
MALELANTISFIGGMLVGAGLLIVLVAVLLCVVLYLGGD